MDPAQSGSMKKPTPSQVIYLLFAPVVLLWILYFGRPYEKAGSAKLMAAGQCCESALMRILIFTLNAGSGPDSSL
jgi:hypothetical protein